jgi:hypothetical protein
MVNSRAKGVQRNKLLRYQAAVETYLLHKTDDIPFTVVWRKYVYPKHFISKGTLYTALDTPITKKLKELDIQIKLDFD